MQNRIPRPEYPRPQLVRDTWMNLNGPWEFEIDHGDSGIERKFYQRDGLSGRINVPFCPESALSGVQYTDFMAAVWYRRAVTLPADWRGQRVLLHFGAVDYHAHVWVNGQKVGEHRGGYTSFTLEITAALGDGDTIITVCARDDNRGMGQPRGKQSAEYHSHHCDYTRTTGIWQTVWLECVPQTYIAAARLTPDAANGALFADVRVDGPARGCAVRLSASYQGRPVGQCAAQIAGETTCLSVALSESHLWMPGDAQLYDLRIELMRGETVLDSAQSYFGLRDLSWQDGALRINGKAVFQRLILDQGFYPDGIYTAPSDDELKADILRSMDMGFNGARLHQKVFEERFLYWADRLGYLVWGEMASWGLDITTPAGLVHFLPEWMESVQRDYSHPALVGWCPFNETWDLDGTKQCNDVLAVTYRVTKAMDATRPVIDTSGNYHVVTDVFDIHDYEQDVAVFAGRYGADAENGGRHTTYPQRQSYGGQAYFVSEYGGIAWNPERKEGWGYGAGPATEQEFLSRYEGLTTTLLKNPNVCAFCYTQLTDVEQELNGLYTYDRRAKFDPAIIRRINTQPAAIEERE
ncbi:MAG: glycoside hydrolase family 2 TIM barrel-domain containing protein [Eubacteriales bacterium]|nr:glycoside hydrolase family 2 TIM barrel-domain containing protein [Eubacteriales bacterium]